MCVQVQQVDSGVRRDSEKPHRRPLPVVGSAFTCAYGYIVRRFTTGNPSDEPPWLPNKALHDTGGCVSAVRSLGPFAAGVVHERSSHRPPDRPRSEMRDRRRGRPRGGPARSPRPTPLSAEAPQVGFRYPSIRCTDVPTTKNRYGRRSVETWSSFSS